MVVRLTVAHELGELADALGAELAARPLTDPFAPELVAVPADGIRTWLTARLAAHLGASDRRRGDGVVANVRFVFPSTLVRMALGRPAEVDPWDVGPLTWAVHRALHDLGDELGLPTHVARARSIAEVFDRYSLHRPEMVRHWEQGRDVDAAGAPLADHARWQPELWRHVVGLVGPSDAVRLEHELRGLARGEPPDDFPERVSVIGLAALPRPQLAALLALGRHRDVHLLAPVPSLDVWARIVEATPTTGRSAARPPVVRRGVDELDAPPTPRHPLAATWSLGATEALWSLARTVDHQVLTESTRSPPGAAHDRTSTSHEDVAAAEPTPVLRALQRAVRSDRPEATSSDARVRVPHKDRSFAWHRCHGPARQVEVLRDALVHLLAEVDDDGRPRFEPRDITVLCPDLDTFAPLIEATFAGDPANGVPAVPVRIADRSLRQDDPLLDTVAALAELADGRFRASDVLDLAGREPVRRRFGFGPEQLGKIAEWIDRTNIRWGVDAAARTRFDVPEHVDSHTWRHGLDQLLVGAAMADGDLRLGPGGVPPVTGLDADDVELLGRLADLVTSLDDISQRLGRAQPVDRWCRTLADAAAAVCAVPDADAWQWRDLHGILDELERDARLGGEPSDLDVTPAELVALITQRLIGRPGRARFDTGTVTVSSPTAVRGVPRRVICVLGIDGETGTAVPLAADDLTTAAPLVGDPDPRIALRAQLLDAVLAADERLVIVSSGRDLRTNAALPAPLVLAELTDAIDATVRLEPPPEREGQRDHPSRAFVREHSRQAWDERNLRADEPWSFDTGACRAALARRRQSPPPALLDEPLDPPPRAPVEVDAVLRALVSPVEVLLQRRLGASLRFTADPVDDLVPLRLGSLERWQLADELLTRELAEGTLDELGMSTWRTYQRERGALPPAALGEVAMAECEEGVARIRAHALAATADPSAPVGIIGLDLDLPDGRRLVGQIGGARGAQLVRVSPSQVRATTELRAWAELVIGHHGAVDAGTEPPIEIVVVGRGREWGRSTARAISLREGAEQEALELLIAMHDTAHRDLVPFFPRTSSQVFAGDLGRAADEWRRSGGPSSLGEGDDRWVLLGLGTIDLDDLLAMPPRPDEQGPAWSDRPSRLERWAHRVWSTVAATASTADIAIDGERSVGDRG